MLKYLAAKPPVTMTVASSEGLIDVFLLQALHSLG